MFTLFLVVEQLVGLIWLVVAIYNIMHVINHAVLGFKKLRDQTISKCLYNLFLAIE